MRHILRPGARVTRKYPYERRELPERSRGLIALLLEPETNIFRCESCLMCEKACPPRAISISYRFRDGFYTGNLGIAGAWPEVTPPPAHDSELSGVDELALARR